VKAIISLESDIPSTPRTVQASGMFDVALTEKLSLHWEHNLPVETKPWNVGLIVGPSGSGKSVLARQLWPDAMNATVNWSQEKTLLDGFPSAIGTKEVTSLLTSVGLGTIPSWFRPYGTLSNGEQFRANMARLLASDLSPVVVDEFTSVVDRQVAKVASHALQKTVRRRESQFVAVTCHYDVVEWLQPDWVYDLATCKFQWRLVQPHPPLRLEIFRASKTEWRLFERHHYLNRSIHPAAQCFTAYLDGVLCAFTSYIHFMHRATRNIKMGHRLVVLPDYQGLGIAGRLDDWLGQWLYERGFRYRNVVAHPAMIHYYARSPRWRETAPRANRVCTTSKAQNRAMQLSSRRLAVRSFEFVPKKQAALA
jgi:ABC-type lipoprotein export system ATPase subunit